MSYKSRRQLLLVVILICLWAPFAAGTAAFAQDVPGVVCAGGQNVVALIVDPVLTEGVRGGLSQFEADLCADGYTIVERMADFPSPVEVRHYLTETYNQTGGRLAGAILVGNIPHAYQFYVTTYANPNIAPTQNEPISFQYYADLNGIFEVSPGFGSPSGKPLSFDIHGGDVNWEIWIGVLPLYKGDYGATIDAINRYFAKNHEYRVNGSTLPRAFLWINEHHHAATQEEHTTLMQGMQSGVYSWTPFSNAGNASIYFDSPVAGMDVFQGYAGLNLGSADFVVVSTHGTPQQSGALNIGWVESNPIRTLFYWDDGCSVGNLDVADNYLTSILYSPTSEALLARGSTANAGGLGSNQNGFYGHNIATALSQGKSFGDAMLSHVNTPLLDPWSQNRVGHMTPIVILGDPTLTIRR